MAAPEHVDVLIVGAGLSGIGAACRLLTDAPDTSFEILEARGSSGGTWDLFRYPGIRSDSDMFTLGYPFRPWTGAGSIVGGDEILRYVRETATAYGVDAKIRYRTRVAGADWTSEDGRWTVTVEDTNSGVRTTKTCTFLYLCSGYYRYDEGYTPAWPGQDAFTGEVIHPQHWPADFDAAGKRILVIGSGATAVTLVPALAKTAAHVTMLQRSPSYVVALPAQDGIAALLRKVMPAHRVFAAVRWKNIRLGTLVYRLFRRYPDRARALLRRGVTRSLPAGYDVDTHFTPAYQPWDQRLCVVPDGDLFASIRSGKVSVATDHVDTFTPTGVSLRSGRTLDADVIVTATGLNLLPLGAIELTVDGSAVRVPQHVVFKGMMLDGVPNMAFALGYTNASWTLKVDLVARYVCRILEYMRRNGYATVTPRLPAAPMATGPFIEMTSGYFQRSRDLLPLQGDRAPWRLRQHYAKDAALFRGAVKRDGLEFGRLDAEVSVAAAQR
ncbi:MAG TPA: NAD(P)/FAD-dependent oxidoreductase [Micromonosporaceae bacterium]|nr:NAD(P)/FAD-dependent oxidoreductase [Micromonosporaceae bacterium]